MTKDAGEVFKLKLDGPGIAVAKEVDRAAALNIIRVLLGDEQASKSTESLVSGHADDVPLSLREFLDSVGARTKVGQIVAISAFLHDALKQKDVGRDEIRVKFAEAAEPMPANFPRDFAKTLKAGWLAPTHGNKDRFYVTQSGRSELKRGIEA
jgi:hypothetical protein